MSIVVGSFQLSPIRNTNHIPSAKSNQIDYYYYRLQWLMMINDSRSDVLCLDEWWNIRFIKILRVNYQIWIALLDADKWRNHNPVLFHCLSSVWKLAKTRTEITTFCALINNRLLFQHRINGRIFRNIWIEINKFIRMTNISCS